MVKNKSGMEMTTTTIVVIVLSIAVLAILLIVLNTQTGFFSKWLKSQTGESTVDPFISNCNSLLDAESSYSYCCDKKEVKFVLGDKAETMKISCGEAQGYNWSKEKLEVFDCLSTVC
jgi:hypothetical protein